MIQFSREISGPPTPYCIFYRVKRGFVLPTNKSISRLIIPLVPISEGVIPDSIERDCKVEFFLDTSWLNGLCPTWVSWGVGRGEGKSAEGEYIHD